MTVHTFVGDQFEKDITRSCSSNLVLEELPYHDCTGTCLVNVIPLLPNGNSVFLQKGTTVYKSGLEKSHLDSMAGHLGRGGATVILWAIQSFSPPTSFVHVARLVWSYIAAIFVSPEFFYRVGIPDMCQPGALPPICPCSHAGERLPPLAMQESLLGAVLVGTVCNYCSMVTWLGLRWPLLLHS